MHKISVIIPVFNTEKFLNKCLESVCNQTLSDIEIICVNNGSIDGSNEILQKFMASDNRIQIINLEQNKGPSFARNIGIEHSHGEYLSFIDSDDFIDLDFYEKLYTKAKEQNADCAKGDIYDYDLGTQKSNLTDFYDQNDKIKKNKAHFLYGFTSAIYKTSFIKNNSIKFPENVKYFEDPYFSIICSIYYNKIVFDNSAKYYYVRHQSSIGSQYTTNEAIKGFIECAKIINEKLNSINYSKEEYLIHTAFLMQQAISRCENTNLSIEMNNLSAECLDYLLRINKYKIDLLKTYFSQKREQKLDDAKKQKQIILKNLRKNLKTKNS